MTDSLRKKASLFLVIVMLSALFNPLKIEAASGLFPKMTSAASVDVIDIRNDSPEAKHVVRALQGLLNQNSARVYIYNSQGDLDWLNYSGRTYNVLPLLSGNNAGLRTLFSKYRNEVQKMIVFDTTKDWTLNIALMKGALGSGIPVTDALKTTLMNEFNWSGTVEDIRNSWSSRVSAYEWALTNLMPYCNKQLLFSLGLRNDWQTAPWFLYDYAVATKSFVFWLDNHNASEKAVIQKICLTPGYPQNGTVMGYGYNGDDLLDTVCPCGFAYVVGDYFANASVWSSFSSKTYTQREGQAVNAQANKIYVALHWSDGDNIQFNQNMSRTIFSQADRGYVPVSMTLSPALQELAPTIPDWYWQNKTGNDEFMGGPSGLQYIWDSYYQRSAFPSWYNLNWQWVNGLGMNVVNASFPWSGTLGTDFLQNCGVSGVINWTDGAYKDAYLDSGKPVICSGAIVGNEGGIYNYLSGLSPSNSRPIFTGVYMVQAGYGDDGYPAIKREVDRLNRDFPGRFVFLSASDISATAKAYFESVKTPYKTCNIPCKIEAEDFDNGGQGAGYYDNTGANEGGAYRTGEMVDIQAGGSNYAVGWTSAGEWLNYTVNVPQANHYYIDTNFSSTSDDVDFTIKLDGEIKYRNKAPNTGSWNNYLSLTNKVYLPAGTHTIQIFFDEGNINIDFLNVRSVDAAGTPYTSFAVPGMIQAENYNNGGQGTAYWDSTSVNEGGAYRNDGVDIAAGGSGFTVGWTTGNEWLNYSIHVYYPGKYVLDTRLATPYTGQQYSIKVDGITQVLNTAPQTGSWNTYSTQSSTLNLTEGDHVIQLFMNTGNMNFDYMKLSFTSGAYSLKILPCRVEAEDYDYGGQNTAYWDSSSTNEGGAYRTSEGVDISQGGSNYNVGWVTSGEWLNYTVYTGSGGTYTFDTRVSTPYNGQQYIVKVDGFPEFVNNVPNTGGWNNYTTLSNSINLTAGMHVIQLYMSTGNVNVDYFEIR